MQVESSVWNSIKQEAEYALSRHIGKILETTPTSLAWEDHTIWSFHHYKICREFSVGRSGEKGLEQWSFSS
jgi:hypothetical protein